MAPLFLIAYVVAVGVLIRVATGWEREKMPLVLLILVAAFVGWFVLIGMITEGDKKFGVSVSRKGVNAGFQLLKAWAWTMLAFLAAGAILALLVWAA